TLCHICIVMSEGMREGGIMDGNTVTVLVMCFWFLLFTVGSGLIWARERLRAFDAELRRLYDRVQQHAAPPVMPSPAANGPVYAHCSGSLSAPARCCDRCGAPAGVPMSPATPAATATSLGPTGTEVISGAASPAP